MRRDREQGVESDDERERRIKETAFSDLTDRENLKFVPHFNVIARSRLSADQISAVSAISIEPADAALGLYYKTSVASAVSGPNPTFKSVQ